MGKKQSSSTRFNRRQINIWFDTRAHDHIERLAKGVGKTKASYVRDLVLDVLREDALAHGEKVRFILDGERRV